MGLSRGDANDDDEVFGEPWPCAVGWSERRLPARALNVWEALRGDAPLPSVSSLESATMAEFADHSLLLGSPTHQAPPSILRISPELAQICDGSEQSLDHHEPVSDTVLSMVWRSYDEVISTSAPVHFEAECVNAQNIAMVYRGSLLPFSNHGPSVDRVLCVLTWKELADRLTTEQLQNEIAMALSPLHREL